MNFYKVEDQTKIFDQRLCENEFPINLKENKCWDQIISKLEKNMNVGLDIDLKVLNLHIQ